MIKLKALLNEAWKITPEAIKTYWNFALNALSGHNPDSYFRSNRQDIEGIAGILVKKYGPTSGGKIYRGIMLDPSEVKDGKIGHIAHIMFVSFTEDIRIAVAFGDTENPMANFMMTRYPNHQGYLITTDYNPSELLFHHKWLTDANMWPIIKQIFTDHSHFMEMQKEVMLRPRSSYNVVPIPPGSSGGLVVGAE